MPTQAIDWLRRHRAFAPDKPFLHVLGAGRRARPHHIFQEWADKYKGKFDDGWDEYPRARLRAPEGSWAGFRPTPSSRRARHRCRPGTAFPRTQRPFQRRLMEIFAGFVEHADAQAGRMVDELERLGMRDNTLSSTSSATTAPAAEGQNGTISELLAQNEIPNTVEQQLAALDKTRRARRAGRPEDRQHVPRRLGLGRQHAVPAHQTGRLALRRHAQPAWWSPGRRASSPTQTPRAQFHHVNDIAPTIYEVLGIKPPEVVDGCHAGSDRRRQHGLHLRRRRRRRRARREQYFENNGSRGTLQGRLDRGGLRSADALGCRALPELAPWDAGATTNGSCTTLARTFRRRNDLAAEEPRAAGSE